MSAAVESHDSLPYIDAEISQSDRDKADGLIRRELSPLHGSAQHPALSTLSEPTFSPLIAQELARCAEGRPWKGGIDTSRYEAPDEPAQDADIETWRAALRNAYTSTTYLSGRHTNLTLLEEFGKNAWLMGNAELEDILKRLEAQLADIKRQIDETNKARKSAQEASRGELTNLEETWRKGIGKVIEVQVATEQLKHELTERRRKAALSSSSSTSASHG